MLKMSKVEIEIIPDPDMYVFFEKGSRGGICYNFNRFSKANNIYDPKQESKHIFLPTSGFKWIDPNEFDLNKYTSNSSKGCVLEVHLEYRKELRELQNDCSLAPDKVEIKREMLSD